MEFSQEFTVNPAFKVEKFDNEILLYAVSSTKGIYLNETAYLVWEMCSQYNSIEEIIVLLEEAYPGQNDTIRMDVLAAVESLVENGALIVENL